MIKWTRQINSLKLGLGQGVQISGAALLEKASWIKQTLNLAMEAA